MSSDIRELDVVALLRRIPDKGLLAGQVGTVVEVLDEGVFEVEFCDDNGKVYAMLALRQDELMILH